jgi:RNA polymerase sigma-70 factor (ECF subfamily)
MIAIAIATRERPFRESPLVGFFKALSSKFGGEVEELPEDEIQRLVDLARGGDRVAGQRLYRGNVDRVYRTVRGMLHSDADAEDVTQDAMLTVLTSLERYSPRPGIRFVAWVTAIAVNTARRRFRRLKPEIAVSGEILDRHDQNVDLERDVEAAQKRAVLLQALAELGRSDRDMVCFRYGAELNASEIAEIVKLKPANVRKMLERARMRLRERIETAIESESEGENQ